MPNESGRTNVLISARSRIATPRARLWDSPVKRVRRRSENRRVPSLAWPEQRRYACLRWPVYRGRTSAVWRPVNRRTPNNGRAPISPWPAIYRRCTEDRWSSINRRRDNNRWRAVVPGYPDVSAMGEASPACKSHPAPPVAIVHPNMCASRDCQNSRTANARAGAHVHRPCRPSVCGFGGRRHHQSAHDAQAKQYHT